MAPGPFDAIDDEEPAASVGNLNSSAMNHASQMGVAIVRGRGIEAVPFGTHVDVAGPRAASDAEDVPDLARIGAVDTDRIVSRVDRSYARRSSRS